MYIIVGSQIILSQILAIQNNNHTQEHKIYVENPFSLKGKIIGQTPNNFTIIKLITIIFVYVSRLKKISLVFFALTHTNYLFQRQQHFLFFFSTHNSLSWLSSFSKQIPLDCSLNSLVCSFFLAPHACLLYKSMPSHS